MSVLLRIDVDRAHMNQPQDYIRTFYGIFPAVKSLGYLEHCKKMVDDLNDRGIRASFFFQTYALPKRDLAQDLLSERHGFGLHAVRTKNFSDDFKNGGITMNNNTKILFVQTLEKFDQIATQFIQKDLDVLRKHFDVRIAQYEGKKRMLKFLIETLKGVLWADLTFSWFADVHAFAAVFVSKIFKRKSIVVVGGYEMAKVPRREEELKR